MNRHSTEDLRVSETTLSDTVVDTCHYTFAHSHRMSNTKSEP